MNYSYLKLSLQIAAILQVTIALLNLKLDRIMGWQEDMKRMPLLIREVHVVHSWFVSLTLAIFAVMTWRFAPEFARASSEPCCWLTASIGIFWGFRTVLQVCYYSSGHWRGQTGRTVIHIAALLIYGGFTLAYLSAAFGIGATR
ncbi:MAG: hypothetical protein JWR26_633 [Pedosphaera sp.]|nr:hypothetical protein [Pedosphaera sp.]